MRDITLRLNGLRPELRDGLASNEEKMTSVPQQQSDDRAKYHAFLTAFSHPEAGAYQAAIEEFFAPDAAINVVHPINDICGGAQYFETVIAPLMAAFRGFCRRDYIVMAGCFDDQDWVSSTGYYAGHFAADWLGIKASDALAYLRVGEFHRMDGGKAVESFIFFDIPELMMALGQWPAGRIDGYCGYLPGPATQDGLRQQASDAAISRASLTMVEEMLRKLNTADEAWRPYWHEHMMWYGPAAFGSYIGVDAFRNFQVPFESAFEGWSGGLSDGSPTRHFSRFGDDYYVCSGGWPSLSGRHVKPFLGQDPSGEMVTMRVCDWWRREGDVLVENWVFVDVPHLLLQLGYDLFGKLERTH